MKNKKILYLLLFLLMFPISIFALVDDEIKLAESLRANAQRALDGLYGTNNFIAQVKVKLSNPKYEVKYTKESNPTMIKKQKDKSYEILPGYSVLKNLSPSELNKMPFDSVTNYLSPKIKKIEIIVLVSNKAKSKIGKARALLIKLLELNLKRGDKVLFSPEKFYVKTEGKPQPIKIVQKEKLFTFQNLFNLIIIILFLAFTLIYVIFHIRKSKDEGGNGDGNTNISVNPNIELPQGLGGPSGDIRLSATPGLKQFFDFIHEGNLDKVLDLINKDKINVEQLSNLIAFVQPRISARILSEIDTKNQAAIALHMLDQKMVNKSAIEKFENSLKLWLECLTGGEKVFQDIFHFVSTEKKKKILEVLGKSNPEGYKKVRSNIILFDDLRFLDDDEIKTILSETSVETLSQALASVEEETYQKIHQNLIKTAKDMVDQFLQLKGANLSQSEIENAQATILELVSHLETENKVNLRDKIKV
jgi:hypothetical protein